MTTCRLKSIAKRVEAANQDSPLCIFETDNKGIYNCVFANTVETRKRIDGNDPSFIGVFHGTAGVDDLLSKIGVEEI